MSDACGFYASGLRPEGRCGNGRGSRHCDAAGRSLCAPGPERGVGPLRDRLNELFQWHDGAVGQHKFGSAGRCIVR